MRRTIREKEPQRPSTRLSTMLDAELTTVAKRQSAEPPKLVHFIRGDLDWIVMKALEKDRTRRFESASGLALDVQRFLKNEPIEARPPSGLYRFQKLVRRNKTAFAAAAAVVAALVLGLGLVALSLRPGAAGAPERKRSRAASRRRRAAAGASCGSRRRRGWRSRRQMREMAPITEKFTTAGRLLSQGKMEEAEQVISDIPPNIPQGSIFYNALAEVYGRLGNWAGAIRNFNRSVTADPTNHYAYHYLAPLLVQTGDLGAYRKLCERALSQFGETADPVVAERIGQGLPDASSARRQPGTTRRKWLIQPWRRVRANPSWPYYMFVKGLAEYRQGHFAGALEWLRKVAAQEGVPARTAQAYATMAMAEYQLGQTNAARLALAQGTKIAETELAKPGRIDWNDSIIAQFLLREAQGLITGSPNRRLTPANERRYPASSAPSSKAIPRRPANCCRWSMTNCASSPPARWPMKPRARHCSPPRWCMRPGCGSAAARTRLGTAARTSSAQPPKRCAASSSKTRAAKRPSVMAPVERGLTFRHSKSQRLLLTTKCWRLMRRSTNWRRWTSRRPSW